MIKCPPFTQKLLLRELIHYNYTLQGGNFSLVFMRISYHSGCLKSEEQNSFLLHRYLDTKNPNESH